MRVRSECRVSVIDIVISCDVTMWPLLIFVCTIPWASSQIDRYKDNSLDWDVRLNVPGDAGSDYPTFSTIPRTDFTCAGRAPGYYADHQTNCQVFRICTAGSTYGFQSFLCPNGTIFNQAVFVCDWWMNVNCGKSYEIQNNYNERFVNLKPGPKLMQDVKKMINHPMRNPINNEFSKTGFLMTQTYKPPPELYPNEITSSHNNNIYVPSKGSFGNIDENFSNDISFAASTASPQYSPYKQNQDTHNLQFIFNQRVQNGQVNKNDYSSHPIITTQTNAYVPRTNEKQLTTFNSHNNKVYNNKNYDTNKKETHLESFKINQMNPLQRQAFDAGNKNPINVEAQKNLVSTNVQPTIISKTIAFKSLVPGDSPGSPKSRITFKTWILNPKSSKLTVKPTFSNNKLIQSALEQTSSTTDPYIYEKPKQSLESSTTTNDNFYNNLETAKQTTETDILYTSPTTFKPNRLYLSPIDSTTQTPRSEISTFKSLANSYLPPTDTEIPSRQYLSPMRSHRIQSNINRKLLTATSSQTPQYELFNTKNNNSPIYSVTKQVKINTNHNNQSITNVLTKEKNDIRVSDIIKNKYKIIKSESIRDKMAQYRNNDHFLNTNELTLDDKTINKEELTSKSPVFPTKSSTLISIPSINLQPPFETSNYITENKLSSLPYYSEPVNTIERTVSIKITIPEKIARILFKNNSSLKDFEVLNTGSSNYLVYANNLASKTASKPTPVGKLSLSKYSNISNSQDLVFSFLADSLHAAKDYNNIAKQSIITTPTPQLQNYRYNNVDDITSNISQLTSTQFTSNNNIHRYNNKQPFAAPSQSFGPQNFYYQQRTQTTPSQFQAGILRPQKTSRIQNLLQNSNQIYSGQLYQRPVPEVTRDYYNLPNIKSNQHTVPRMNSATSFQNPVHNVKQNNPNIEIVHSQQLPFSRIEQKSKQETFSEQTEKPNLRSLLTLTNGITAQVKDSIKGSLSHPSDNDKLLTYKKDQSYYIFSQLNGNHEDNRINEVSNGKSRYYDDLNLKLVPSVAYNLNDEKENQRLVSTLQSMLDGQRGSYEQNTNQHDIGTNVDYIVNHPSHGDKIKKGNAASTYIPNQSQTNKNLNIEDLDSNEPNGYPKISPQPYFNT